MDIKRRSLLLGAAAATGGLPLAQAKWWPCSTAEEVAYRFAQVLSDHDIEAFAALYTDDSINHQHSAAEAPLAQGMTPKEATVAHFQDRLTGVPDLQVTIEALVANGDQVAASFVYFGTNTGPMLGYPPTNQPFKVTSCDIFRVRNGKIVEHWGMGDIAGALAQVQP